MSHDQHHDEPEYEDSGIPQPWNVLAPSPWPLIGALAAGALAEGAVLYMHGVKFTWGALTVNVNYWGIVLGLLSVLAVMFFWWRDVIKESVIEKGFSPSTKLGFRYGMLLFIASEVMFFFAFFWAYYASAFFPSAAIGGIWPPANIKMGSPLDIPFFMTLILLLSGTTVTWAHHAAMEGKRKDMIKALALTVALGLSFTACQVIEYMHADFSLKTGIFGSTFFMATGFHGLHVMIGTIFLAVCLWRAKENQLTPKAHFGLVAAAWYWHFVDVVWLFLFVSVYWYGASH